MPNTWGLNFFLLDPVIKKPEDALDPEEVLSKHTIKDGMGFTGTLYYKFGDAHPPEWTQFVNPQLKTAIDFPDSQSVSAVLFVRTKKASYAYVFGVGGRSLLKPEAVIPDFGKKTVLNIADPKELRSIDLRTIRDQPFMMRQQPSRGARMRSFGIDTLQDHLRAITGIPHGRYVDLAKQVAGADSLSYRATLDFAELGKKSDEFLDAFNSNAYQQIKDFVWIDQITLVRSPTTVEALDAELQSRINIADVEFAPPDMIDWDRGPNFECVYGKRISARQAFLYLDSILDALDVQDLAAVTIDQLRELRVHCYYDDATKPDLKWRGYDCIRIDLTRANEHYVLAGGRWSLIEANFLNVVNKYVDNLKHQHSGLPPADSQHDINSDGNLDEGAYIGRLTGNNPRMAKVHQCGQKVSVEGVEVEFCDIYDLDKDFIHLKIWRASQGFSALAMQASNAAELLLNNRAFLAECRGLLQGLGNQFTDVLPDDFNPREYRIVIGLIRKAAREIPFFSRLT